MKQFNLQEYLKNPSQKVITRDGRDARIVCTDVKSDFPVIALVYCRDNKEDICTYHKNGHTLNEYESPNDLFFVSIKKEGWVNMFKNNNGTYITSYIYQTKDEAEEVGKESNNYISTHKIEWEE